MCIVCGMQVGGFGWATSAVDAMTELHLPNGVLELSAPPGAPCARWSSNRVIRKQPAKSTRTLAHGCRFCLAGDLPVAAPRPPHPRLLDRFMLVPTLRTSEDANRLTLMFHSFPCERPRTLNASGL